MSTTLAGKTILVTGATSGIGLATAEGLVRQGTDVIGVGRSISRCQTAEQRLAGLNSAVQVTYITADLTLQSEVRRLAREIPKILAARGRTALDGLVNNAGAFTYWLALTPEGFETQWAVNYLAPFLLTNELLPLLQAAPSARIVTVSSESHYNTRLNWTDIQLRRHYNGLLAYKQTKLADVLFTADRKASRPSRHSGRTVDMCVRFAAKTRAPSAVRKPPETFCFTLNMRMKARPDCVEGH